MRSAFEIICQPHNHTGESPTWSVKEQALYWVDIPVGKIYRWHESEGVKSWQTDTAIGCALPHENGSLIGGQTHTITELVCQPDESILLPRERYTVPHLQADMRLNDGCADRQGRLWVGSMQQDNNGSPIGTLYRLANQQLSAQVQGLYTPNGLAFSTDGTIMYLSDSHPKSQIIWAFDYEREAGAISNQRVFVDMHQYSGRPDGTTVDSEDCYWICGIDSGQIHRFDPQGKLIQSYELPVKKPTKCVFGGADMRTLFVTSLTSHDTHVSDKTQRQSQALDGAVFAMQAPVAGIADTLLSAAHV